MVQAKDDNVHNLAGAVRCKPHTDRESQIDEHERRKQDPTAQLKKIYNNEVAISVQCHA